MDEPRKSASQPAMQASKMLSLPTQSSDIPLVSIFCSDLSRLLSSLVALPEVW